MNLISKKRRQEIEELANLKLQENNIFEPNFDLIKHLTEKEDFKIILENMESDTNGLVFINPKDDSEKRKISKLIAVNSKLQSQPNFAQRLRFIVAHEYGHSLLHYNGKTLFAHRSTSKKWRRNEREADYFAKCLLMPQAQIKQILFEDLLFVDDISYKVKYISKFFNVTEKKAKARIKDIGMTITMKEKKEKLKELMHNA